MNDFNEKIALEKTREFGLKVLEKTDKQTYECILKAVFDDMDALGDLLFLVSTVDKKLSSAILALLAACGDRITKLEQTIKTYEVALKTEGKEVSR